MARFLWVYGLLGLLMTQVQAEDVEGLEFFESHVRPILANRCQSCHGAEKQKGGLRLDSRGAILKGGDTGPALVPGKVAESLLFEAITYADDLRMPPKSKLPEHEVATLKQWIDQGAPWPVETAKIAATKNFDFTARAKHWSFQPVGNPAAPSTKDQLWPRGAIDTFLLEKLEAAGLRPAADVNKQTLIRRLTFDLIGLPPTPQEIDEFLLDQTADAYPKLVDRLLASPHYGERWGRHWLDLVRYAETAGHEFDYETPDAWRYRDYVIKAFNDDLPYDKFVVEQLAGDLLPKPRTNSDGSNESVIGTGFYFLGEGTHSPVDLRDDQAIHIDNQIDVLGKTFFGLTVACARCHDHKFDPIRQADYYAVAGYLKSSRFDHALIDASDRFQPKIEDLRKRQAALLGRFSNSPQLSASLTAITKADPAMLLPEHPLFAWTSLLDVDAEHFDDARTRVQEKIRATPPDESVLFEDFNQPDYAGWSVSGTAFGTGPSGPAAIHVSEKEALPVGAGVAHSGLISNKLSGVLRSKTFPISKRYIHYRAWGKSGRIHTVVDGFEKIRDPIYGPLIVKVESPNPVWITQDVKMWIGQSAYLEFSDGGTVIYDIGPVGYHQKDGYLAVDEIRFSDSAPPPVDPKRVTVGLLEVDSRAELLSKFDRVAAATLYAWRTGDCLPSERVEWLAWFIREGWISGELGLVDDLKHYGEIEATLPSPTFALTITDGPSEDAALAIRGNPHTLGEAVRRRPLEVLGGLNFETPPIGSGRLAFAEAAVSSTHPLTARVMVNRLWKHHFGAGLVPSLDDFGAMGQAPTHPELLDHLAKEFIQSGWSIKSMHRKMLVSHAYQMSSDLNVAVDQLDPGNVRLHRMPVVRLEAEVIRDAILAVSGRLDRTMYGPSVPTHLTSFMEGRGRPGVSGPLDGNGRKSIYLAVRRNFPNPFLLAFDAPQPNSTIGRRNVSNVPAQALCLLNDPFVLEQAATWATRVLTGSADNRERIRTLYRVGFGREPQAGEVLDALEFLGADSRETHVWAELCHVLLNSKEFIFIK